MIEISDKDQQLIRNSNLFDPDWYPNKYPDVGMADMDSLEHFLHIGIHLGRNPHALFDTAWYLAENPDVAEAGHTPLGHYLKHGWREGRNPHPLFDVSWYLAKNPDVTEADLEPLGHYLKHGWKEGRDPHPLFNITWYLDQYPDIAEAGIEPLEHFIDQAGFEGRQPHAFFPTQKVLDRCPHLSEHRRNPLEFYVSGDWSEDPCPEATAYLEVIPLNGSLPAISRIHEAERLESIPTDSLLSPGAPSTDIRAVALYLPQYHAIPENDEWWGKGFTEWTNVRRARPFYEGHYQPHVPHPDIGYYDLHDGAVLERQADMARAAGIEGFCFYYYWFNGRRLLNMPTDRMLASGKPDFPYCFCWANENWTRTWDGGDKEVLVGQEHSPENDERFILDLLPAFRDPRYIRVDGKPLLVVYRPGLLPDPAATAERWREICRREGIGEIFLARMQMFDWELQGKETGFDTVIQFAPVSRTFSPSIRDSTKLIEPDSFQGQVYDYRCTAGNYPYEEIGETLWPGVAPSWDNTARRMERGNSWRFATPERYHRWLETVAKRARQSLPPQQRFVFINAWNEWAEGCHLEPDEKHGYAWLNATRLALTEGTPPEATPRRRVLVVGHDAARAGAQIVLLTMLQEWRALDQWDFQIILVSDGVLRKDFEKACDTLVLTDYSTDDLQNQALKRFCSPAPDVILANTVVIGPSLSALKHLGVPVVAYIHELQKSIERWASGPIMAATVENSDHFIAVSNPVAENLIQNHNIPSQNISRLNPYIKTSHSVPPERIAAIREELGVHPGEKLVFGCGTMDWRKGPDLFAQVAVDVLKDVPNARFLWMGGDTGGEASARAHESAQDPRICFIGERESPRDYLALGSAFFLSSREDPYPLVALEAADAGLPVVCFADAGGMPEFVGNDCGRTVPFEDTHAATRALVEMLSDEDLRQSLGSTAQASVRAKHDSAQGSADVFAILENLCPETHGRRCPKVSVIIPNYNYATFLPERIDSILQQTFQDFEIIILDDASTDDSLQVIENYRSKHPGLIRVIPNRQNSGSPYPQWLLGIQEARGELVWIAEADDSCEPDFLETLVPCFDDPSIGIAYCQSLGIDEQGHVTRNDFLEHTEALHPDRWKSDYTELGIREAVDWMAYRNPIINASGALIRREALHNVDEELLTYRSCGDWFLYLKILLNSNVAYKARSLNKFRRHSGAVTHTTNQSESYLQELARIRIFISQNFPLHSSQIERMDEFLDRDYVFDGISKPSQHPATRPLLNEATRNTRNRMRLAFISTNHSTHTGGSEILWQQAAVEARRRGHDVITVTKAWDPAPPFVAEFAQLGIKHLATENHAHDTIISFRPDLVVISTGNQDEGGLEFQKFIPAEIPYAVLNQLTKEEQYSPSISPEHDKMVRDGLAQAVKVFFTSKNNHQVMEQRLECTIPHWEQIFNPLDIPPGEPLPMPDFSAGIQIAFPANILFVHKGHDILLEVMSMDKWRNRSVTINLYGKGEDWDKVSRILEDRNISNVHLRGFIQPDEIWKQNHALLLASRMEGQSLALIGAMIASRVPIVTAVGGSAEVIEDNHSGFLAASPSVEDLDDAMERAYQRLDEWSQIAQNARDSALKQVANDPVGDFVDKLENVDKLEKTVPACEDEVITIKSGNNQCAG